MFRGQIAEMLDRSRSALAMLGRTSGATKREIEEAREAHLQAQSDVAGARALFDLLVAHRAGRAALPERFDEASFLSRAQAEGVVDTISTFQPVHFPATFPEVFLRDRPGFDCLIGNPPWEKVVADRKVWWGMHLPGVRSLPVAKRRARIAALEARRPDLAAEFVSERDRAEALKLVLRASFPNLGSGQTDLYKAFSWANLALCREGGKIGVVLPRTAVSDAGMANWRNELVQSASVSLSQPQSASVSLSQPQSASVSLTRII